MPAATAAPESTSPPAEPAADVPDPEDLPEALRLTGFAVQYQCTKLAPCLDGGESSPDGARLIVYSPEGEPSAVIRLQGPGQVFHVWKTGDTLGYFFQDFSSARIQEIRRDTVQREYNLPGAYTFLGVPGLGRFAATMLPGTTDSGFSEIHMVPGQGYIAVASVTHELALPIQIFQKGEYDLTLWYTEEPYGIGGDIVFPVWYGLHWLNGVDPVQVLAKDKNFSGVSADGSLVAYTSIPSGKLVVRDWQTREETGFDLLPGRDRGAGYAVFSPDGTHVAWVEAGGSLAAGDFATTLRIASLDGAPPLDWQPEQIAAFTGREAITFRPSAWLDDHTLLVSVDPGGKGDNPLVLVLDLLDSAAPQVIEGFLVGLVWGD